MQLTWLLDEKGEEAGVSNLRPAITTIGDRYLTISRQEARIGSQELTLPLHASPVLAYGSVEFVKAIRNDFYPGKWCDWTALRCDRYFAKVGALLVNDDYLLLPASEVMRRQSGLLKQWNPLFLRPSRADKPFSGFVARSGDDIERQLAKVEPYDLVVVACAKEIDAEYRMVAVRDKGIVAASQYMQNGQFVIQPEAPARVVEVANSVVEMLGEDFPDPMYIVDIGYVEGEYRLLEINGFSYAILYGCDLEAIVRAAHESAMHEWRVMQL